MNGPDQKYASLLPTIAFIGFVLVVASDGLVAQVTLPALSFATPAEGDDRTAKFGLALEAASVAAEAELFDLSFEAIKRICAEGPPSQNLRSKVAC